MSHSSSGEWQHVIPLSAEDDFEVVLPTAQEVHRAASSTDSPRSQTTSRIADNIDNANIGDQIIPLSQRMEQWRKLRNRQRSQLGDSITKTFAELAQEQPEQTEEINIRRAIELSMLDFALVDYKHKVLQASESSTFRPAHDVLGVSATASKKQVITAYRGLCRIHHPDKGGNAHRFAEIARAYRTMLTSLNGGGLEASDHHVLGSSMMVPEDEAAGLKIKSTAHWDQELQDHRRLVNDLFQADGMDLNACVLKQLASLELLGLDFKDAGASNRNEQNEIIRNSCFYLSLATSYLWGIGALSYQSGDDEDDWLDERDQELLIGETALQLKRTIEAAVVKAHPEWCLQGKVGEEVQAFSDFLVYTLDSPTLLSDWTIVVFDNTSGFCDIYKGQQYERNTVLDPAWGQTNTITLRYIPGHYQPLIPVSARARRPTLNDIVTALDSHGVFYVVTDGNS